MSAGLASANTISIFDGAVLKGSVSSGTLNIDLLGYLPGETPYVPPGVTSQTFAQLFDVNPSPGTIEPFFDALAGLDVGASTQVPCVPAGSCNTNFAFNASTTYFSLKLGNLTAFFQNTTGFALALTFNQLGTAAGLSHITLFGDTLPTPAIPLPGGILLLLSALGGLGFLTRFRKANVTA